MRGVLGLVMLATASSAATAQPHPREIEQAIELRARMGVREATSPYTVYVHSINAHHLIVEFTRIATRGTNGIWTEVSVGEERPGLVGDDTEIIPERRRMLSPAESRRLDRLVQDMNLFAERPEATDPIWLAGSSTPWKSSRPNDAQSFAGPGDCEEGPVRSRM